MASATDIHLMLSCTGSFKTLSPSMAQMATLWTTMCWPQEQDYLKPGNTLRPHTEGKVRISRVKGMPCRQNNRRTCQGPRVTILCSASLWMGPLSPTFLRPPLLPHYAFLVPGLTNSHSSRLQSQMYSEAAWGMEIHEAVQSG